MQPSPVSSSREEIWRSFTGALRTQFTPSDPAKRVFIQESWARSKRAGVNRSEPLLRRVQGFELKATAASDRLLAAAAETHLQRYSVAHSISHLVILTNKRGVILLSFGDPIWRALQGAMDGYDWSEEQMGTNGAGTALATDQAVILVGPEHYVEKFHSATCIGIPLHGPDGALIGAIDFSCTVEDAKPEQVLEMMELANVIERDFGMAASAPQSSPSK